MAGHFSLPCCPKSGAFQGYSHYCHPFKLIKLTWMNLLGTNKGTLTQTAVQAGSKGCLALGEGRDGKMTEDTDEQLQW